MPEQQLMPTRTDYEYFANKRVFEKPPCENNGYALPDYGIEFSKYHDTIFLGAKLNFSRRNLYERQ